MVGAGYVASRHLNALRDLPFVEIAGICDVNQTRAAELANKYGNPPVFPNLEAMGAANQGSNTLGSVNIGAVHILTPPESHCALTLKAIEMGCHVFVEKPMAETAEECDRMMAAAAAKNLVISVNHSFRFEPPVLQALELLRSGAIGEVLNATYFRGSDYPAYRGGPPSAVYRQGSYPFRDLGVHALYLMEAFLGPIKSLNEKHFRRGNDPMLSFDEWRASVEGEKATGEILLSWNMKPLQNDLWVQGTKGLIHVDAFLGQCRHYKTYPGPKQLHFIINGMRHAFQDLKGIPSFVFGAASGKIKPSPGIYAAVVAFHEALADGKPVPVSADEGLRAVALVAAASVKADLEKDQIEAAREARIPAPARILVTGGSGFVGSAVLRKLKARGETPRVFLRRPAAPGSAAEGLDAVYGCLGEPDAVDRAVAGVEVVFHVGAAMKGGPFEFEEGTIWGTRNMIDACLKHGVKRLIYVSSIGVLDHAGHREGVPVNEESPVEPNPDLRGAYSSTKLLAEQLALTAIRERGLPAVIIRPGQIFGPGAELVTPNGVIKLAGQWLVAGSGSRAIPAVYIDDVADGLLAAETAPNAVGKIIHLIDPQRLTQNQYLEWARHALGATPIRRVPNAVFMTLAWMLDIIAGMMKR